MKFEPVDVRFRHLVDIGKGKYQRHCATTELGDFGTELAEETAIRVYDSTADMRYFVIPQRPEGTEG